MINTGRTAFFIFSLIFFASLAGAQSVPRNIERELAKKEDSLKVFSDKMINAPEASERFRADSNFIRGLVRCLVMKHSFYHPFDSLRTVSILYAPDSSFRIFTWQLKKDEYVYLQKGAIQLNTASGELKLFPLFDYSMYTSKPLDSIRSKDNWIGAIYYRVIMKEHRGKKYFTLLGFDDYTISSNKKWMEVLTFNERQEPVFGGPFISFKEDTTRKPVQARFNIEYKKEANTLLNYDPDLDMIVFDHLISETEEPDKKNTYIPDGSYEGFKWKDGQWVHVDKVFDFKLQDGQFPVDAKLRDDQGNIDEKKLEEASQRNIEKAEKKKK
ncbi:MAG: hypothetical protein JNK79_05440 [Chitinophagaceae bacterium]|nr:hypothetical protein [Chitinophagaceae bacterium]